MIDKDFIRDFFGVKRQPVSISYRWVVVREDCSVTDNQHPQWAKPLFKAWTAEGWEIDSVTMRPGRRGSISDMAIGVLRQPLSQGEKS